MEAKEAISRLKSDLGAVRAGGRATVQIEALEQYLAQLEQEAGNSLEYQKLELQRSLAQFDATHQSGIEMFRSVIEAGKEALNAALLINGGAVVAILSFLGSAVSKGESAKLGLALTLPLLSFGAGVLAGALAFAGRYFTQYFYERENTRPAVTFHILTVVLGTAAYVAFGTGVYKGYLAFAAQFAAP